MPNSLAVAASFHQGLFDLETDRRLFEEMIARRVVDELRAVHDGQLLCVRRTANGIGAELTRDDALLRIYADLEHGCRSFDLTYEEWERHFHDVKVLVPGLRVPRFRFELRTQAELARQVFEDEHVSLVRLEDEMRAVSEELGGRTKVSEHKSCLLPARVPNQSVTRVEDLASRKSERTCSVGHHARITALR